MRRVKEGTSAVLFAIRSEWNWWDRFHEMLQLSAKFYRSLIWWKKKQVWENVLDNHFKDPINECGSLYEYHECICEESVQESINLKRKSYLNYPLDTPLSAMKNLEKKKKKDWMSVHFEELETMGRIGKSTRKKIQFKGKLYFSIEMKTFLFFPVADGRITFIERDQELRTSFFDTGPANSRRKIQVFRKRIKKISTSIISKTHFPMSMKR